MDGSELIGRLFESKSLGKGFVFLGVESESMTAACRPSGIQIEQFSRGITRLGSGLTPSFFPLARAQCMQRSVFWCSAGVSANQLQRADRHKQLCLVGVHQLEKFGCTVAQIHRDQSAIATDPMVGMNDRVADF